MFLKATIILLGFFPLKKLYAVDILIFYEKNTFYPLGTQWLLEESESNFSLLSNIFLLLLLSSLMYIRNKDFRFQAGCLLASLFSLL